MSIARIRKDDTVIVITGDAAGQTGKVLRVIPEKGMAVVQGLNTVKNARRRSGFRI
jgi:large subunit ribosomal protein L24